MFVVAILVLALVLFCFMLSSLRGPVSSLKTLWDAGSWSSESTESKARAPTLEIPEAEDTRSWMSRIQTEDSQGTSFRHPTLPRLVVATTSSSAWLSSPTSAHPFL